jgi:hypothetical protein
MLVIDGSESPIEVRELAEYPSHGGSHRRALVLWKIALGHVWGMSQRTTGDNSGIERAVAIRP